MSNEVPPPPLPSDPRMQALRDALSRNQPDLVIELGLELGENSPDTRPILFILREAVRRVLADFEAFGDERRPFYRHEPEYYHALFEDILNELSALGSDAFVR